jgi:SNF2 family DNA or RNA helicase
MITEVPLNFTPYGWQVQAFRRFVDDELAGFALLADVGTGKTATAILILNYLHLHRGLIRGLVVGPTVIIHNWKNEIIKYSSTVEEGPGLMDIPIYAIGDPKKRREKVKDLSKYGAPGIVITNYESFDNEEFTNAVAKWGPQAIVCDELHRIKSYKSKRAKNIVKLGDNARFRLGLTGSAILNSPMDLFMQWKFIDKGESFGSNFFNFRNLYFKDANASWAGRANYIPKWEPRPEMFDQLAERIKCSSIRVIKSECMDLPPFIEETIKLQMSAKQKRIYDQMEKDFVAFLDGSSAAGGVAVAQLALTKALRLMQIASGFVSTDGPEGGEVLLEENVKLDALEKIIEDNPEEKIIVWCSYKANYRAIGERLTKLGVNHVFLTGEQNAKEKQESIDAFQTVREVKCIVANRKAGGIGVNLTAASISVVFSRNFSLEEEIQSDGRNYRGGSQIHERITKINLVVEGTIEERVIEALKNKENISEIILARR